MLTITDLGVRYGTTVAVDRVDLEVPDGRVLCLLGPSGCGKSTMLRAVAGLEPVGAGTVAWDGRDLAGVPVHRRGFGLMFQSGVLFPHLDVAGNIAYGLRREARERGRAWRRHRVGELLELVGLAGFGARGVTTLSGGQAQRVALARALAPSPRLLLLDEPLAALDAELRERLVQTLREVLTATSTTALYVTHDQREAFAVADTVALMRGGRIRQIGAPAGIWSAPASEWVAGFVGYTSVVDRVQLAVLGLVGLPAESRIALRPGALVLSRQGSVRGVCVSVMPGPEVIRLRVDVAGLGTVEALSALHDEVVAGQGVRLAFDAAGVAGLPPRAADLPTREG